jgi:molybdate transport system substrate-binding protein
VAVATNFLEPARKIVEQFEKDSGHKVTLAGGSSGKLAAQILHGAPFDVFLSADQERVGLLVDRQAAVADSRFTYARGQLALWSPDKLPVTVDGLGSLRLDPGERMAIANARLAPYGLAAEQALKAAGCWMCSGPGWYTAKTSVRHFPSWPPAMRGWGWWR